jgi:hypothetical protein
MLTATHNQSTTKKSVRKLCLLVVSATDSVVVDLKSGLMFRCEIHDSLLSICSPFDVIEVGAISKPKENDPAKPEYVELMGNAKSTGKRLRKRKVHKLLKPLISKGKTPLLGFRGPSASYWTLTGFQPSLAIVIPDRGPLLIRRKDGSAWVRFGFGQFVEELMVQDKSIQAALNETVRSRFVGKQLAQFLGWKPKYLIIGLSSPVNGHCYKKVLGLLP